MGSNTAKNSLKNRSKPPETKAMPARHFVTTTQHSHSTTLPGPKNALLQQAHASFQTLSLLAITGHGTTLIGSP